MYVFTLYEEIWIFNYIYVLLPVAEQGETGSLPDRSSKGSYIPVSYAKINMVDSEQWKLHLHTGGSEAHRKGRTAGGHPAS